MQRLLIFIFLSVQSIAFSQTASTEQINAYLGSNGSMLQYEYAYDELLKMLGSQYPKTVANKEGWEYLEANKEKALVDIKKLLVPVYDAEFTNDEMKNMLNFYQSDTGKQLVNDRSKMTDVQKEELNAFYNTAVGEKIIAKQPILTKEISKASENWSRDLYETALSLLK